MTALRPEHESGAGHGGSFTDGFSYGTGGEQGTSYGQQQPLPYGAPGTLGGGDWYDTTQQGAYSYGGADAAYGGVDAAGGGAAGTDGGTAYLPPVDEHAYPPPVDEETVALRIPGPPPRRAERTRRTDGTGYTTGTGGTAAYGTDTAYGTDGARPESPVATGGRAERRKASRKRHGRRDGANTPSEGSGAPQGRDAPQAPLSRVEARRRARERKASPAVVASRGIGEVFITCGVLMLLFVTYQLWWTNVRAQAQAGQEASDLQKDWADGKRNPGVFEPGQGFALLHIPKLDVVVPVAEGIDSKKVLDRGMVGHYAEGALKTAMPNDKKGNFGVAGHRNTHGEPFRYINRLERGDPIVVETQDTYFVYKMESILPVTPPSNVSVLEPVPKGSGFTGPGRYITLTTCTPEFTSKYRMIVWGKMDEERPRSKGKPDALVR
ncbi:class E sortase [Streptomyces sp. MAR25Y5]|uniref:class E sortase n=1 Tax=Streptomyces sp. MAR25Y5 TaxID=2962028 RepID=UPI0020B86075|nr:class E sortase [Streptomyces sp. MAR25Y5]MCP3769373.1 class E sortase [Streptomyces sp. MAR25Y5]